MQKPSSNADHAISTAYANACNMSYDCEDAAYGLDQLDYNSVVEDFEGDEIKAKKELIRGYRADLKAAVKGLGELAKAAQALADALPVVGEERIAELMELEYTGEDEPGDDDGQTYY